MLHCRDETSMQGDVSPDSAAEALTAPESGNHPSVPRKRGGGW